MGQNLGVGAHLVKLVRTQAGKFRVENSVQLDGIRHGMPIENCGYSGNIVLTFDGNIAAIAKTDGNKIKVKKVFL